ncbi:cupin domain-containing protein [Aquabacterium sp. A7-Y]|uniref:cupin domain-containing protein n=1 Tax=Aquabacterium sp. A7-Y TaxID=1349605 RepID=UPI00223E32C1|nr:cupin domain-containing protein [Aquabacterium sp. A7-Y]MCW7537032.1 cupin domain-containing protein [Aquabacterium sp. A7-Y]
MDCVPRPEETRNRAAELIELLQLQPHPEGGHFREFHRSASTVAPEDGRPARSSLTSIDFLLTNGQFSAWHRVASDEAWHLLEGGPLRLWLMPPEAGGLQSVELGLAGATRRPRHVVPAGWWQAAEPLGEFAYVGATVGPGFDSADFSFLRGDPAALARLRALRADLLRLV